MDGGFKIIDRPECTLCKSSFGRFRKEDWVKMEKVFGLITDVINPVGSSLCIDTVMDLNKTLIITNFFF